MGYHVAGPWAGQHGVDGRGGQDEAGVRDSAELRWDSRQDEQGCGHRCGMAITCVESVGGETRGDGGVRRSGWLCECGCSRLVATLELRTHIARLFLLFCVLLHTYHVDTAHGRCWWVGATDAPLPLTLQFSSVHGCGGQGWCG
jgi:hypothetical protein